MTPIDQGIPTSDAEATTCRAVETSLPQKPDPVATVAEDISEGLNNGSEARPVEPTAHPRNTACRVAGKHEGHYYCKHCGLDLTPDIPEQHGLYNDSYGAARG